MTSLLIDPSQLKKLEQAIAGTPRKLQTELRLAVNATAKKTVRIMAKQISLQVKTPIKAITPKIKISRKATGEALSAEVFIRPSARIPLRDFGARQTKTGVSYQIDRKGKRAVLPGAFTVESLGGHVFQRFGEKTFKHTGRYAGKFRQRIDKKYGPSPWGVFVKGQARGPSVEECKAELAKQIDRRIQFITFKKTGV
jgi:hypothetical protein